MLIECKNLSHVYVPGSPMSHKALDDINLSIEKGEFIGVIGQTGSGKSTLVQHFNGLLLPTSGKVLIEGKDISSDKKSLKEIRKRVGLVFQYPEHQLFEETVAKDIGFGPTNLGFSKDEVEERSRYALEKVGLSYDELKDRSPFELSGGQKRRVAIAGVLAMMPEVLILDEPTAGLDPQGKKDIFEKITELYKELNITIILVSHSMEDIAELVNRLFVMHEGKIKISGKPREVFGESDILEELGLGVPQITLLMNELRQKGLEVPSDVFTVESAKKILLPYLKDKRK
ncbi:energy-coupling factor transporter ATPase [Natranaerofaba carboxydovora]|uniref:energy-coupling factor transporter ATPase n=1 Tax=Natranaerofaba carboxydovora TaxID=2742683 RepID=UPI001F13DEA1|nr:energy-coupling factor transporter ATPase [Natranaerofaba carboxydovora]UMZ75423.1 Energy-coupling factor transporter ATP-binding protein EcfA2 [Natranaerofaba carboxydovora]